MSRARRTLNHRHDQRFTVPDAREGEVDPAPLRQWCRAMHPTALGWEFLAAFETLTDAITFANQASMRVVVFSRDGRKRLFDNGKV